jgi:hypothetical protein
MDEVYFSWQAFCCLHIPVMSHSDSGVCRPLIPGQIVRFFDISRKWWTASAGIQEQNWSDPKNYVMLGLYNKQGGQHGTKDTDREKNQRNLAHEMGVPPGWSYPTPFESSRISHAGHD